MIYQFLDEIQTGRLAWALVAATASDDHAGREVLLDRLPTDPEAIKLLVTALSAFAGSGMLHAAAGDLAQVLTVIRQRLASLALQEAVALRVADQRRHQNTDYGASIRSSSADTPASQTGTNGSAGRGDDLAV